MQRQKQKVFLREDETRRRDHCVTKDGCGMSESETGFDR
jgi:hypothetical protein